MEDIIRIRLKGKGISPGLIRSREIAEILESIEDMVIYETLKSQPTLSKDDIVVGIMEIEDKSIGLNFKTSLANIIIPILITTTQAINNNEFDSLTSNTLKSLQTISNFSRKHNCDAIFGIGNQLEIATITPSTEIPTPTYIEGLSEIIGKVIRVGGKKPKAMIELTDGSTIYCEVPEDVAKELGHQLYSLARFYGLAKWDSKTLELEEFKITSAEEFQSKDVNMIFKDLANIIGDQLNNITDVEKYVSNIRYDEDK
ncbi:hypothetical protein IVG45_03240 [Methylomonas sp. LL1]|uniref:hypothetical protein n=1 Tax=Methylomonas sp. LL1 TaxID=2785785 RepID=UPI0018C3926B|nr:hypothetical protein [Methylomonas sp. LL1]QPK64006.1 hypothetical protein IVG45_03240 [Methylomonas sp. LL1]